MHTALKLVALRIIGVLLVTQAIVRAILIYPNLNFSDVMSASELIVLIAAAVAVGVGTASQWRWARFGGLALCAFGLFSEYYFWKTWTGEIPTQWVAATVFFVTTFVLGLAVYLFLWVARPRRKH
jgi:hypothetical protein